MAQVKNPHVEFHTLPHADGSATYSHHGYTILGSVNGPLEASRRDELPDEAFVEIHVRPATGAGGPRDRALETLLHRTLTPLIHTTHHPRALIQITLQLLSTPTSTASTAPSHQSTSILPSLPHLIHTALLALLAANIPLRSTCTSVFVAAKVVEQLPGQGAAMGGHAELDENSVDPSVVIGEGGSCHVFAFGAGNVKSIANSGNGMNGQTNDDDMNEETDTEGEAALLLAQSEGEFDVETWERAAKFAEERCRAVGGLQEWLRNVVGGMVQEAGKWRG